MILRRFFLAYPRVCHHMTLQRKQAPDLQHIDDLMADGTVMIHAVFKNMAHEHISVSVRAFQNN